MVSSNSPLSLCLLNFYVFPVSSISFVVLLLYSSLILLAVSLRLSSQGLAFRLLASAYLACEAILGGRGG